MNFIYIKAEDNIIEKKINIIEKIFDGYEIHKLENGHTLIIDKRNINDCFSETDGFISYTLGYMRDYRLGTNVTSNEHNISVTAEIIKNKWPLNENFTGSFSTFSWDKVNKLISIANDPIGIYPLYYYQGEDIQIISSHLILTASISMEEIDYTGVSERLMYPEFCNFGTRTIVKNVKSLLPGELVVFDQKNMEIKNKFYDNSFYSNVTKPKKNIAAKESWELIKKEFAYCFLQNKQIGLAMSGGFDSRLILGAIDDSKEIYGMTYGDKEDYETKISKRCLETRNANFQSYSIYKEQFPKKEIFEKYILKTEATGIMPWLSILENSLGLKKDSIYLLGDLCDGLTGKSITIFKGRKTKIKNFFKYMIFNRELPFTPLTVDLFAKWKKNVTEKFINQFNKLEETNFPISKNKIISEIKKDLDVMFERINKHNIPYVELLDEIFIWYTHGRIPMSKQLLQAKIKFLPLAPIMSMQLYRNSSNIHPDIRMDFTLLEKIFDEKEFDKLNSIPTAQVPFVPSRTNILVKFLVWGLRSTIDQLLIKLYRKNISTRQRVLKSLNWEKAYQDKDAIKNTNTWFEVDYINKKMFTLNTVKSRADGTSWPLTTMDIASISTLNIEIDLIKKLQKTDF